MNYTNLPAKFARTRTSHGNIPPACISMIGADQRFAGRGYGRDLLVDALKRIARAADAFGIAVVMLDVLDHGDPSFVDAGRPSTKAMASHHYYGFLLPLGAVRSLIERPS